MSEQNGEKMTREERIRAIAYVCHEANHTWCLIHGDYSQARWEFAAPWQRESAIRGVDVALSGASAEQQHEAWRMDKEKDGWALGPVKDEELKTHPCMVPYVELPEMQKAKDALFRSIVHALAPSLGFFQEKDATPEGIVI